MKKPQASRILVLAPHPDDEVLGCGGLLRKYSLAGNEIHIVYMTDGSEGRTFGQAREEISKTRKAEAKAGLEALGLGNSSSTWLDFPDGQLSVTEDSVHSVEREIMSFQPELILCTFIHDQHMDHCATTLILAEVLRRNPIQAEILAYEVWSPYPKSAVLDVSEDFECKLQALRCHKSQIQLVDYERLISGLNQYRAMLYNSILRNRAEQRAKIRNTVISEGMLDLISYAEGYIKFNVTTFVQTIDQYSRLMKENVFES
ncbi:LmbE family N-acetylglucosaminyl deacetylase [Paenibacillus wynnii]|nr:LmbE family N-acetylglucosaminyl deacetylase [Paenibacillus wynnii]